MLSSKAKTVEELEELDRLETARESGNPVDPGDAESDRQAKRLRGESSADSAAVGLDRSVGSPGAGSAAAPHGASELVDSARLSPMPALDASFGDFDFGSFVFAATPVLDGPGFDDGSFQ